MVRHQRAQAASAQILLLFSMAAVAGRLFGFLFIGSFFCLLRDLHIISHRKPNRSGRSELQLIYLFLVLNVERSSI